MTLFTRKFRAAVLVALILPLALLSVSCGGDDGEKSAEVSITAIEPASSYPGVNTEISFEITPGEGTNAGELSWMVRFGDGQSASGEELNDSVSHSYEDSGQYLIEVVAMAGDQEAGSATRELQVLSPVDVAVSDTRGTPANVQSEDTLTVSFAASNEEAGPVLTPFDVSVYLSESANVSVEDIEDLDVLGTQRVEADVEGEPVIPAGEQASLGLSVQVPADISSGDYHVVVWINPQGQLSDTNPDNNLDVSGGIIRVENPDQVLPDLAVTDVVLIPDRAFPTLNQLTRGFTITNRGSVEAFDAVAKTYLSIGDATLEPDSDRLLEETSPFNVPPNDEVVFDPKEFVLDNEIAPSAGEELQVYLIVEVAIQGDASEADLDNNVEVAPNPTIVSDQRVDGTDIVVRDFTVTPNSTFLDGTLEATLTLANEGTLDASSFFCGIYLGSSPQVNTNNDPRLSNINISGLASDTEETIVQSFVVPGLYDPGTYYMYVVCDPLGALDEPYRSNNQKVYLEEISITDEADVDLYIDSLDVPATANEGDTVEVTATICVSGSNPSGTTRGRLYRSAGVQPDFSDDPLTEFEIPNINPGTCESVVISTEASCADFQDQYGYGIEVDYSDRLPESDEDNNTAVTGDLVTVSGQFCSCSPDSNTNDSATNPFPLSPGQYADSVCDPEQCDFYGADLQANQSLLVTTTFDADQGQLETTLFGPSGINQLDKSVADGRQEVATFLVSDAGRYIFSVCGKNTDTQNLYDVDVEVLSPSPGVDVLPRNLEVPQANSFSIGSELDISFRVYNIGQTATSGSFPANIVVSPNNVLGDGDDIALQPASVTVQQVAGGSSQDVSATVTIPTSVSDGDYYIGVDLDIADGDTTNNGVTSRKITVETLCYDPLEPNDDYAEARSMNPGSYSNLVACTAADDYYELCVENGKKFTVSTSFDSSQGDIDMELFDQQFQIIDSSANAGVDNESVSVDYVNGAQCYYARVYLLSLQQDQQTSYDMNISVQDVDPSLQCDGLFEPNDTSDSAASLLAALQQTTTLDRCPAADSDYYYVSLSAGQTVSLRGILDPSSQPGTLRVQLYKPNGAPGPNMETAPGAPVAELADYVAPSSGRYYLQVTVSGTQRRVTYRLEADGIGGIDLEASNLVIGPGTYGPNDEVRFGYDLSNLRSDPATAPSYKVWLGQSATHDPSSDQQLGSFTLSSDVAGNSTVGVADRVMLPGAPELWDGTGYLHVVVEADSSQTDPNPSNDVATTSISLSTSTAP